MKKVLITLVTILLTLLLAACGNSPKSDATTSSGSPVAGNKPELTVAAASDLAKAFAEVGAVFEKSNNCTVTFSFGSTGTLAEQIANGAPFDLFAAANESVIDELDQGGHISSGTSRLYAVGRIGFMTQKERAISVTTMEDLLKPEIVKIAIANPDHAPYGLAAKQALITAELWERVEPKLVYGRNISETMTFVTTGNTEVGIIALSLKDDTVNFTLIDAGMHEPLRQAIAVLKRSAQQELAKDFISFVRSDDGQAIMTKYGFILPKE